MALNCRLRSAGLHSNPTYLQRNTLPHSILKIALLSCLLVAHSPAWSVQWRYDDIERIVAISDVHGDLGAMTETLQSAKLLDQDLRWSGEQAHLVVVGDVLDRGPNSRQVMELLMRIEDEALASGGQVHVLIGNHESMLLTGDMRYVSAEEYAAFAADEDLEERAAWRALFIKRGGGNRRALRASFEKKFPLGFFAMRRAFRADGRYGAWLLEKNVIAVLNGTAFVHGGVSPEIAKIGLRAINVDLQEELRAYVESLAVLADAGVLLPTDSHYDYAALLANYRPAPSASQELMGAIELAAAYQGSFLLGGDGPLWYRSNVRCQTLVEEHRLADVLRAIDADRLVVGHTPTSNRHVLQRFGGRMIEIDTGMLNDYYGGSGHALIIEGEKISVVSQTGTVTLEIPEQPRRVGWRPGGLTTEQLQALLLNGEIRSINHRRASRTRGDARTIVSIEDGQHAVDAVFIKRLSNGVLPSAAAYRLDRLLGLDMVPVTVVRQVEGKVGSLQFLPDRRENEKERAASGDGGAAACDLSQQWAAMYVFDVLIRNEGRTPQRMLYDTTSWQLLLSEHDRAFGTERSRPVHLRGVTLPLNSGWQAALTRLTDEILAEQLSDVLDKRRRSALAARRDQLLDEIDSAAATN